MRKTPVNKTCENCDNEFQTLDNRRRYCSKSCATQKNNEGRIVSDERKTKISQSLKQFFENNPDRIRRGKKQSLRVAAFTRGKYREYPPESILELSKRTVSKILKRLEIGCSRCNWNEGSCDIHHIGGRKISNADNHDNLCLVCPNCHRLAHEKKINPKELVTLTDYVGDKWKEFYFG